jgi:hypothetical protein
MVFVVLGLVLGAVMSVGLALALDYFDPSFRTPSEVLSELNIPVLAAVPHRVSGGYGSTFAEQGSARPGDSEPVEVYSVPVQSSRQ